jgi:hypothetical protein
MFLEMRTTNNNMTGTDPNLDDIKRLSMKTNKVALELCSGKTN